MWLYDKKLEYPIKIKKPDPKMAKVIITQYGGPDGELAASLRYLSQRFSMVTPEAKATLNDIGTEEMAHLEMVGTMVKQLTENASIEDIKRAGLDAYYSDHDKAVYPVSAAGVPFTAAYIQSKGDPMTDLYEDMAAEQKARSTYEYLINLASDPDVIDPLTFLREREIVHFQRFGESLRLVQDYLENKKRFSMPKTFGARTIGDINRINAVNPMNDMNRMNTVNPVNDMNRMNPVNPMNDMNRMNPMNPMNDMNRMNTVNPMNDIPGRSLGYIKMDDEASMPTMQRMRNVPRNEPQSVPGRPSEPGLPINPQIPGRPSEPGLPINPQIPGRPSEPGLPINPQIPGRPSEPGLPINPQITRMTMPGAAPSGMNMPGMNLPEMNMPEMNMPEMNMPEMNMPGMMNMHGTMSNQNTMSTPNIMSGRTNAPVNMNMPGNMSNQNTVTGKKNMPVNMNMPDNMSNPNTMKGGTNKPGNMPNQTTAPNMRDMQNVPGTPMMPEIRRVQTPRDMSAQPWK